MGQLKSEIIKFFKVPDFGYYKSYFIAGGDSQVVTAPDSGSGGVDHREFKSPSPHISNFFLRILPSQILIFKNSESEY